MRHVGTLRSAASVAVLGVALGAAVAGCDMGQFTVNTTSKVLIRAQPSIKQEADWELAARALPGTLKTVEGFWIVDPGNPRLLAILTEGYCQYGIGFVEDEWEEAGARKDFDAQQYHSTRASKMFVRCINYALKQLGKGWQEGLFKDPASVEKLVAGIGGGNRNPAMWVGIGLGALINQNKDNVDIVGELATPKMILTKITELDAKHPPKDPMLAATPHVALGLVYSAVAPQLGGDAKKATEHFLKALELTGDKFLLARVHYAKRVGVMTQDRKLFREQLLKVLQTDPAIWPEQRLANEIAHRKARRYLRMEKELF